ncbi:MAG: hypothetical protein ACXV74_08710 [Methylobacter sp.]
MMKNIISGVIGSLIAAFFAAILFFNENNLLHERTLENQHLQQQLARLDEQNKRLDEDHIKDREEIERLKEGYAHDSLATLEIKRKEALESLSFYRNYLLNLDPIKAYQSKTKNEKFVVLDDRNPSDIVGRTVVLNTLDAFCSLRNYYELFVVREFLAVPPSVSAQIASFFAKTALDCGLIAISAETLVADNWIRNFGHGISSITLFDYRVLSSHYDEIIRRAAEVFVVINKAERSLNGTNRQE